MHFHFENGMKNKHSAGKKESLLLLSPLLVRTKLYALILGLEQATVDGVPNTDVLFQPLTVCLFCFFNISCGFSEFIVEHEENC